MFGSRRAQDPYAATGERSDQPVPTVAVPSSSCLVEVHPASVISQPDGPSQPIQFLNNTTTGNDQSIAIENQSAHAQSISALPSQHIDRISHDPEAQQQHPQHQEYIAVANAVPTAWSALQPNVIPTPVARDNGQDVYERERILLNLYQRSRFVRLVAILDMCFIIVFGLFSLWFFILLPFPFCGYLGARKWMYRLLFVYALYLVVELIGSVVSFIFLRDTSFLLVRIIYTVLNLIVARYTINLASYILVMDEQDLQFVKHSPIITNIERNMIC